MAEVAVGRLDDEAVEQLLTQFEELLGRVEGVPGPTVEAALHAIQALAEIYGEALTRVVEHADPAQLDQLADDQLVGHLLALHGLHPEPVADRVAHALAEVEPHLGEGNTVELAGIHDGVASIRVSASGCGSAGLADSVADVVLAAAPELNRVEPVTEQPAAAEPLIPVESLLQRPGALS